MLYYDNIYYSLNMENSLNPCCKQNMTTETVLNVKRNDPWNWANFDHGTGCKQFFGDLLDHAKKNQISKL